MMGKDNQKNLPKGFNKNFSSNSFLTVFIKEFIKFDTLIKIYFHDSKEVIPQHEKVKELVNLAQNLKIMKDEEYVANLCRKLKYLMENKVKYLLNRCRARNHPLEYALLLGPRWLRDAEPRIQMLPIVANQMMSGPPANNSWGVWELNSELIQNAIRAIKSGYDMTDPVVVKDLSNTMNIESSMILQHWIRACKHVRDALNSLKSASASRIKGDNKLFMDWTVADFLLLYDPSLTLVGPKTLTYKEHLIMLGELFSLTSLYNIEDLLLKRNYTDLFDAWIKIYTSLTRSVINISLVYLQRCWHELKYQARSQVINYLHRGKQPPVPDKLLLDIVCRFKNLLHKPFPKWSDVVDSNVVVQIKKFEEKEVPVASRRSIIVPGPSKSNVDRDTTKRPENPKIGYLCILPVVKATKKVIIHPPNNASSSSIDLLNNIDPSKATVRLIFDSDSDEETVETASHEISDQIEFEEHTTTFNITEEDDSATPNEGQTECAGADIDPSVSVDAQNLETNCDTEEIVTTSADIGNNETERIDIVENQESIEVVTTDVDSNNSDNVTESEVYANEQTHIQVDTESVDLVTVDTQNEATNLIVEDEQSFHNDEQVISQENKLLMIPVVPLERCDLTASWKLHSSDISIDSRKYIDKSHHPLERTEEKLAKNGVKIEETHRKSEKLLRTERSQSVVRSSRRLRELSGRIQRVRKRRVGEEQIRNVLSTLSKEFLQNDRNIQLLVRCRPLTVDLVRLAGTDASPRARPAKKVQLPDIEQVRKINSTMLTAEVAPVAKVMVNKVRVISTPPMTSTNENNAVLDTPTPGIDKNYTNPDSVMVRRRLKTRNDQTNEGLRTGNAVKVSPANDIVKKSKSNADYCREYYYRRKVAKATERQRAGLPVEKTIRKSGAERNRAYRLRKKTVVKARKSPVIKKLHTKPPLSTYPSSSAGPSSQSAIKNFNHPDVAKDRGTVKSQNTSSKRSSKLSEGGRCYPSVVKKHLKNNKIPVIRKNEKRGVKRNDTVTSTTTKSNRVSVIVAGSRNSKKTAPSGGDNENDNGVRKVSDMHCIMESRSSVRAPKDAEHVNDDQQGPKSFRIVRIVRSAENVSGVPPTDEASTSSKAKSKRTDTNVEKKASSPDEEENVELDLMRDKLRRERKRNHNSEDDNAKTRIFFNAYKEWLREKSVGLKYFQLPGEKRPNPSTSANTANTPIFKKINQPKPAVDDQPKKKAAENQHERTITSVILKNIETQSVKQKQPTSQYAFIDLTGADEPVSNQQNPSQKRTEQNQTTSEVPYQNIAVNIQAGEQPRMAPLQTQPCVVPMQTQPRMVPVQTQPCVIPVQTQPRMVPVQTQPCVVPAQTQPRMVPVQTQPCVVPVQTQPCVVPAQTQPRMVPVQTQPCVVPVQTQPCMVPVQTQPCVVPAQTQPRMVPVQTQPCVVPVQTQPCMVPVPTQPRMVPVQTQPCVVPVQTQPRMVPVQTQPCMVPVQTQPCVVPAQTQPRMVPVQTQPCVVPVQTQPCVVPAQTQPRMVPVQTQPCVVPVQTQPCVVPVRTQPRMVPVQTQPCVVPAQTQPCVVPAQTQPHMVSVQTQPCVVPVQAQPCMVPVQTQPCVVPVQTQPCMVPVPTQPCVVPVQTQPCMVPVPTQPCMVPVPTQPCMVPVPTQPCMVPVPTQPCMVPVQTQPCMVPVQTQPCQYQPTSTLMVRPMTQPSPFELHYPYVRVATIKTPTGEYHVLMPRNQNHIDGAAVQQAVQQTLHQAMQQNLQVAVQQNVVTNVQENVANAAAQAPAQPRTPYITITPKALNTGEDSSVATQLVSSSCRNEAGVPTSIPPPLRTYSKTQPPMKILRVDSSRPQLALYEGMRLVVTTGDLKISHPTYWSLVPNQDRIRVLFPAENGGMCEYNPQAVVIDKPLEDNTPFARWVRTVFPSGAGNETEKNSQHVAEIDQTSRDPRPAARIKVKSFARMTDEDLARQEVAPDRVCIRNQLYQKFCDAPLAYAEMLTVLSDFETVKSLIAANVPVFLLSQSGVIMTRWMNELNKPTLTESCGGNHSHTTPAQAQTAPESSSSASESTNKISQRNSTAVTTEKPTRIQTNSIGNPSSRADASATGRSVVTYTRGGANMSGPSQRTKDNRMHPDAAKQ